MATRSSCDLCRWLTLLPVLATAAPVLPKPISYTLDPSLPGTGKYTASAVARDGRIFAPPYGFSGSANQVLVFDPSKNSTSFLSEVYTENYKYCTCAVAHDGRIFAAPYGATRVLVIEPSKNVSYQLPDDLGTGTKKYLASSVVSDGRIVAVPLLATRILVIVPSTNSTYYLSGYLGTSQTNQKYSTCVLAANGILFSPPWQEERVLAINPFTNSSFLLQETYQTSTSSPASLYESCVLALDGRIFCAPADARYTLVIVPTTLSSYQLTQLDLGSTAYKYATSQLVPDGRIMAVPDNAEFVLVINPATNSSSYMPGSVQQPFSWKYWSSVLAPDGRIFAVPFHDFNVLVIDPVLYTATRLSDTSFTGLYNYETSVVDNFGRIIAVPKDSNRILIVDPGYVYTQAPVSITLSPVSQSPSSDPTASPITATPTTCPTTTPTRNPVTLSPTTSSPASSAPVTASPASASPATASPASASPATASPATTSPATASPVTAAPATTSPASASPATISPATASPMTATPATASPQTVSPATVAPSALISASIMVPETLSPAVRLHIDAQLDAPGLLVVDRCVWNVTRLSDGVEVPLSTGRADFSVALPAGTLLPGMSYMFRFEALYGAGQSAVAVATRSTSVSPVVASIAGGSSRVVSVSEALTLNASASYDPDRVTGAQNSYSWQCRWRATSVSVWDPTPCIALPGTASGPALTLSANSMFANAAFEFNLTYTVNVTTGAVQLVRSSSASVLVIAVPDPIPTCQVSLANSDSDRVPYGRPIQLLASALPHPSSTTSRFALRYSWNVSSPHSATALGISSVAGPSVEIPFSELLEPNTVFEFTVVVFDDGLASSPSAATTIQVTTGLRPLVSLRVSPSSGFALQTSFGFNATATGEPPLRFTFSYAITADSNEREVFLVADSYNPTLNTSLPAGSPVKARVKVQGALGGVIMAGYNVTVEEPPIVRGGVVVCTQVRATVDRIRRVLDQDGAVDPSQHGICSGVLAGIQALLDTGRFAEATRSILYIQTSVDRMLANLTADIGGDSARSLDISQCTDPPVQINALQGSDTHGCSGAAAGTLTYDDMASHLWSLLLQKMLRANDLQSSLEQTSLPAIVATVELTTSPAANLSADSINSLAKGTSRIVANIEPADLAGSSAGDEAASVVSKLVEAASRATTTQNTSQAGSSGGVASGASPTPREADASLCDALSRALGVADALLLRAGSALVPGSKPLSFRTNVLESRSRSTFADTESRLELSDSPDGISSQPTLVLPASRGVSEGDLRRSTRVAALAQWSGVGSCRSGTADATLSKLYSVTLEDSGARVHTFAGDGKMSLTLESDASGAQSGDGATCAFWDTLRNDWNASGCALSETNAVAGQFVCTCSHLTEFAVIQRQREADGPETLPAAARAVYPLFVAIFAVEAVVAALICFALIRISKTSRLKKSKRTGAVRSLRVVASAGGLALARVVGCVLFGQIAGSEFTVASKPSAAFAVGACTYVFSYTLVSQLLYQWVVLIKSTEKLGHNQFESYWCGYIVSNLTIVAAVVAIFTIAATSNSSSTFTGGSISLAVICVAFAVGLLYTGLKFHGMMGMSKQGRVAKMLTLLRQLASVSCFCFIVQSAAWIATSVVGAQMSDNVLYGLAAVYLSADAVMVASSLRIYSHVCSCKKTLDSKSGRSGQSTNGSVGRQSRSVEMSSVALSTENTSGLRDSKGFDRLPSGVSPLYARQRSTLAPAGITKRASFLALHNTRGSLSRGSVSVPGRESLGRESLSALDDSGVSPLCGADSKSRNSGRIEAIDALISPSGGPGQAFFADADRTADPRDAADAERAAGSPTSPRLSRRRSSIAFCSRTHSIAL